MWATSMESASRLQAFTSALREADVGLRDALTLVRVSIMSRNDHLLKALSPEVAAQWAAGLDGIVL